MLKYRVDKDPYDIEETLFSGKLTRTIEPGLTILSVAMAQESQLFSTTSRTHIRKMRNIKYSPGMDFAIKA